MPDIAVHPVTPERWPDLEQLFGPSGAFAGCWCMFFRVRSKDFAVRKARDNRTAMEQSVGAGEEPGLIAYVDGRPAGWVSLGPRQAFARLQHSRKFAPIDDRPVWSIVCFVIGKEFRRRGLSERLLQEAIEYSRGRGATMLEAYPVEAGRELKGDAGYQGIRSVFERAGFVEAAKVAGGRAIMRLPL